MARKFKVHGYYYDGKQMYTMYMDEDGKIIMKKEKKCHQHIHYDFSALHINPSLLMLYLIWGLGGSIPQSMNDQQKPITN